MQWKHYITHCVSHQNAYNYSLSAIDYNNYIDNYDSGKNLHLILKITFFIYNIGWNRGMKDKSKR